jgi:CubicO group peptidase (beta-lactamase class C family)
VRLAVRATPGVVRMMGSGGQFSWPGAGATDWWVDPKEELAVTCLSTAAGPLRWHSSPEDQRAGHQAMVDECEQTRF